MRIKRPDLTDYRCIAFPLIAFGLLCSITALVLLIVLR